MNKYLKLEFFIFYSFDDRISELEFKNLCVLISPLLKPSFDIFPEIEPSLEFDVFFESFNELNFQFIIEFPGVDILESSLILLNPPIPE